MCNCNNKRAQYSTQSNQRGTAQVKYTGDGTLNINGDITGRVYSFSEQDPIQKMDSRDARFIKDYPDLIQFS